MHSHAGTKEACHMGVLVVAFFWIPACAGMTRKTQFSVKLTAIFQIMNNENYFHQ